MGFYLFQRKYGWGRLPLDSLLRLTLSLDPNVLPTLALLPLVEPFILCNNGLRVEPRNTSTQLVANELS